MSRALAMIVRHNLEFLLARAALAVLPRLPRPAIVLLARALGAAAAVLLRGQRAIARANLDIVFGETKSPSEKSLIIRRSFQSFALLLLDLFWFSRDAEARVRANVSVDPAHDPGVFGPGARICITAHYGNWELLGMAIAQHGGTITSVAAPLANEPLDRLFTDLRTATGQRILSKHGALRGLLTALRNGERVGLVLDQNTRPHTGGIFVTLFGLPALMSPGPAALALRTGAPLVLTVCRPCGHGRYEMPPSVAIASADLDPRAAGSELELTRRIAAALEDLLRSVPDHWLWMYKRWKYVPPGHDGTGLPFYTKKLNQKDRVALD